MPASLPEPKTSLSLKSRDQKTKSFRFVLSVTNRNITFSVKVVTHEEVKTSDGIEVMPR